MTDLRAQIEPVLAQLRHAYRNLVTPEHENGTSRLWFMKERQSFADGLIAPQIRKLEALLADHAAPVVGETPREIEDTTRPSGADEPEQGRGSHPLTPIEKETR
jgi:hypothetical protein